MQSTFARFLSFFDQFVAHCGPFLVHFSPISSIFLQARQLTSAPNQSKHKVLATYSSQ